MDFARKQLEKYGWSEGKGLGKNENGIAKALKPKLKRNVTGVGHDAGAEFTDHWWTDLYNKAATNIQVEERNGRTKKIKAVDSSEFVITNNMWHLKKAKKDAKINAEEKKYADYFIKTELLDGGTAKIKKVKESDSESEDEKKDVSKMTDEELFAACEGRTVHKGARHGLKALGKLARIEQQEKMLLSQPKYEEYSYTKTKKNQLKGSSKSSHSNVAECTVEGNLKKCKNKSVFKCNDDEESGDALKAKNDLGVEKFPDNDNESIFKVKKKKKKLKNCNVEGIKYDGNTNNDNVESKKRETKTNVSAGGENVEDRDSDLGISDGLNTNGSNVTQQNVDDNTHLLGINLENELELIEKQHCKNANKCKRRKKSDRNLTYSEINSKNVNSTVDGVEITVKVPTDVLNNVAHIDDGKNILSKKKKKKA